MFCVFFLQAQSNDPLQTKDKESQEKWVNAIIDKLTIEEKIGQLFMVQTYSTNDTVNEKVVEEMILKYHAGSLIFMQGTPKKQAELTNRYQAMSKYPLLVALDAEWGLDMRLQNAFRFPWNMTLGAVRDNSLIEEFGERLGEQCKRLGIHINFAPVVDININPNNPIIGNRSFGENKNNVTDKAIAFTRGMQKMGVMANAKHFPGHGDTAADSHHTLPVINFDATRLDTLELYPYYKLFKENLGSVMTAHLSIPKLEPNKKLPSSLSKRITTGLLKEKMGFKGLIITDGLNMKGAADFATSKEINLEAILAGNDLLLIPHKVPATMEFFKKAIQDKKLSIERLDESVRKILKAKYWSGLQNYKPIDLNNLHEDLNTKEDEILHRKLVKNSITVLKNDENIIPIQKLEKQKIAYVKIGEDDSTPFLKMLNNYAKVEVVSAENTTALLTKLKPYNLVIIGYHTSNDHPWKGFKFKNEDLSKIEQIAKNKKVILDIFASPYSLLDVKSFENIEGLVVSYQNSTVAQEISAQQLFGAIETKGKLPVSINNFFEEGFGLYTSSLSRLQYGIPEEVKMSSIKLAEIDVLANEVIKKKMTPGMQILVARSGKVIYQKSFGFHTDNSLLKVKNSALTVKLNQKPKANKSGGSGWGSGRPSQMQEIMGQLDMTSDQQNKMRSVYPKLGKLRASLELKNMSPEKIGKEMQLFIENGLIDVLTDEQKNKYFTLKESLNIKKVFKLVDGEHKQVDLVTGLNSGGYTEIIKGELNEGDQVISKITVETSQKKALRLF